MVPEAEVVRAALERPEVDCAVLAPTEGMRVGAVARLRRALDEAGVRHYSGTRDGQRLALPNGSCVHVLSEAGGGVATRGLARLARALLQRRLLRVIRAIRCSEMGA